MPMNARKPDAPSSNSSLIRIFVSHRIDRENKVLEGPLYVPVRCGAVQDKRKNVRLQGDDTGKNISHKRNWMSEMTVQYWAWKNVRADFYGLCHYRRYFSFADRIFRTDNQGTVSFRSLESCAQKARLLDTEAAKKKIIPYDLVLTTPFDVRRHGCQNLYEQFGRSPGLCREDLLTSADLVKQMHPEYAESLDAYLGGIMLYPCCMFIMKRELFDAYCEWLFPILFELETRKQLSSSERTLGHIAERLMGVFAFQMQKKEHLSINILQRCLVLDELSNGQYMAHVVKTELQKLWS